jgi:hypothetical protein
VDGVFDSDPDYRGDARENKKSHENPWDLPSGGACKKKKPSAVAGKASFCFGA